jgi:AbiV family abortive infection protein
MKKNKNTTLSFDQLCSGLLAAIQTAEQLLEEAKTLFRQRHFAGAFSKSIISLEEIGKHRILFYQAALMHNDQQTQPGWPKFWHSYYSHLSKLNSALQWQIFMSKIAPKTKDDLAEILQLARDKAQELDSTKQVSQYSDFIDGRFSASADSKTMRSQCSHFINICKMLISAARKNFSKKCSVQEFTRIIDIKVKYANALHFLDHKDQLEFDEKVLHLYSDIFSMDGGKLPSHRKFIKRVRERYRLLPSSIPVTLRTLGNSVEFAEFLRMKRKKYGYPDWIVLSVVYNIVFNHMRENDIVPPAGWPGFSESGFRAPIEGKDSICPPLTLFLDADQFEVMIDMWLAAFLAGLGVGAPTNIRADTYQIRRIASHYYDVFVADVKHKPIFSFDFQE